MIRRTFWVGLCVYALTVLALAAFSASYLNPTAPPRTDIIVCLGGGVDEKGNLGPFAQARAEMCTALYAAGTAPLILFTGGNDHAGAPSGAAGMAKVAVSGGVPVNAVLVEHDSRSTLQNALFSMPLMTGADSILIVTDAYHLPRSALSFAAMGDWQIKLWASENHRPLPFWGDTWDKIPREALAFWFNLARYSAWRIGKAAGLEDIDYWLT